MSRLIFINSIYIQNAADIHREHYRLLGFLFTATSCVCVTGLVVVDTAVEFTAFGQVIILLLIQIGGLGFMTMATVLFIIR